MKTNKMPLTNKKNQKKQGLTFNKYQDWYELAQIDESD